MRILVGHNFYRQGGGEHVAFESEAELLRQNGNDVSTFTVDNADIRTRQLPLTALSTIWSMRTYRRLRHVLRKQQIQIATFHNTFPQLSPAVYYACRSLGVPVVQWVHNFRLLCPAGTFWRDGVVCEECLHSLKASIRHRCYRSSRGGTAVVATMLATHRSLGTWDKVVDRYVVQNKFQRDKLASSGVVPAAKMVMKPNFVSPDPGAGRHNGGYAVFVGRLAPEKGIRTMLSAWRMIGGRVPLKIVGGGPLSQEVSAFAATEAGTTVEYLGEKHHDDVLAVMKDASFMVFPSEWYEGHPFTLIEAFATGLPVLASDIGAAREITERGRVGVLYKAGDASDLAEKVIALWNDPQHRQMLETASRAAYENKYTAAVSYGVMAPVFQELLESRRQQ